MKALAPVSILVLALAGTGCAGARGDGMATPGLPAEDAALAGAVDAFATERAARDEFAGVVLLARQGRPFLHAAYGLADRERRKANTTTTRFNVASLGKMFTAVAIAQLVQEGKLNFDDPVGRHLPDLRNAPLRERVTIHHLLTHTSGIPDMPESLFDDPPSELAGYLPFLETAELEFEAGSQRSYSNSGFVVAGLVLEAVTGERYPTRIERRIFAPAGMEGAGFDPETPTPAAAAYGKGTDGEGAGRPVRTNESRHLGGPHGGASATAEDLLRFFAALWGGELVDASVATTLTTPRQGAAAAYGFGVLDFARDRLVGHSGGDAGVSADAYHYPRHGYTIVVLSNLEPPSSHDVARHARKLLEPRFE